ncbi:uncharacterized protein JCM15063_003043 [Sporobolomyces koalae]|uniref:uncharacterized protein n=1 Tax=Sporobolomyces koalae TaxID=500713 RepID=UPI00316C01DE
MATVASNSSNHASPVQSPVLHLQQPQSSGQKAPRTQSRMMRTLSRFLSGGGGSGGNQGTKPAATKRTSRSPSPPSSPPRPAPRTGDTDDSLSTRSTRSTLSRDDDGSLVAHYPADSVSRLSRHSSRSTSIYRHDHPLRDHDDQDRNDDDDDDAADTDASIYPQPPSTRGPSSIRTHASTNSSSFAPTHASTYRSTTSTKPTTLLSIDSNTTNAHHQPGANRIATVAADPSPSTFSSLYPTVNASSQNSPTGPQPNHRARPLSSSTTSSILSASLNPVGGTTATLGVPSHTQAHPRNNPHPSHVPSDNASVMTLASSSFAPSITTATSGPGADGVRPPSPLSPTSIPVSATTTGRNNATSGSAWGGGGLNSLKAWSLKRGVQGSTTTSEQVVPEGSSWLDADEDASVRVLPGSRRNSQDSLGGKSTWSARVVPGLGTNKNVLNSSLSTTTSAVPNNDDKESRMRRRTSSLRTSLLDDENFTNRETQDVDADEAVETEAQGVKKRAQERTSASTPGSPELAPAIPLV